MNLVQAMAEMGADASKMAGKKLSNEISEEVSEDSKIWCIMFPEKDGDEPQDEDKEEKSEIKLH